MKLTQGNRLLFIGDSVTDVGRERPVAQGTLFNRLGRGYPHIVSGMINALYPELGINVINTGVSGDTAQDGLERLSELDDYNPYMVLIEFGANDYMRKRPFDQTKQALSDIVDYVQQRGAIAVIVDTGGPGMGKYTDLMKDLAKEKKAVFVPGIMAGIFTDRSLKSDMIHPNAKGYAIIAQRIHKRIKPYVE